MAMLPPRKTKTASAENNRKQSLTPLQTLLQMGFPQHRAEKALAATANRGVQLATDWLMAHVNDTSLDSSTCREYIIYACPSDTFMEQLTEFWERSANECGRNGAHNFMPHITLVSFFQVPDKYANALVCILESVLDEVIKEVTLQDLQLELYTSANFMGFFLSDQGSDFLKRIAVLCAEKITDLVGVQVDPHLKSLHLTLAYQFDLSHKETLKALIASTIIAKPRSWVIKLYSREATTVHRQVYKVVYAHIPQSDDELELRIGDCICVCKENIINSVDGWVDGTSWLTGCNGHFPLCYTERTAESDTWTLHCSLPLKNNSHDNNVNEDTTDSSSPQSCKPRKIYICRHGERVDFTFGTWVPYSFDSGGKYVRKDLNMPPNVPQRHDFPNAYITDTPLTCVGEHQAKLTGCGMKAADLTKSIKHVYCSPSLRCIQTCHNILVGLEMDKEISICIEPGIFEWLGWYNQTGLPDWMNYDELIAAGFNINSKYEALVPLLQLNDKITETVEQYYMRCDNVVQNLIKTTELKGGDILLVGHACSLVSLSSSLLHKSPCSKKNFVKMVKEIPYCGLVTLMNNRLHDWTFVEPPVPPLTNSNNKRFNWKFLTTDSESSPN